MGLAEKRAVKEFQDNVLPGLQDQINEAAGKTIEFDVDWDTLMTEDCDPSYYGENFEKVYFLPLISTFKSICADDMGREALGEALQKVSIKNASDVSSASASGFASFSDGVLAIDHKPASNVEYGEERSKALITLLENSL